MGGAVGSGAGGLGGLMANGNRDPNGAYGGAQNYGGPSYGGGTNAWNTNRPPGFAGNDPPAPGTGGNIQWPPEPGTGNNNGGNGPSNPPDWLKALLEKYGIAWPGTGTGTGGTGGPGGTAPQTLAWSFPQYSQTWAFTPPAPVYPSLPPPFDKDKYKSKNNTSLIGNTNG